MFQTKNIITAVEIGTTKVCALVGETDRHGNMVILGCGETPSEGAVCKGEIVDMKLAFNAVSRAFEAADKTAGKVVDHENLFVAVTGADIQSHQGVGTVLISPGEGKVTEEHIEEAVKNARTKALPAEQRQINTFDSYFVIDDKRKLMNPLDQNAHKLEAHIHVISGDQNRIKNFETIFQNLGFEKGAIPVFSGVASAFGTLTAEEKENGTLLIDLGGGTAEFMAVRDMGILHSGTVPVGLDHVANDLSVGLDLYIDVCRKIITDKKYLQHKADGKPHMEFTRMTSSVPLKTPIISIDTIIEQRLREIFEIIRRRLEKENVLSALNFGAVITGGGALFPPAVDIMRSVFELPVRIGEPLGVSGAVTNMSTPRHSAVWGLLKFGEEMRRAIELSSGKSMFDRVIDLFDNMSLPVFRNFSSIKNTIKI